MNNIIFDIKIQIIINNNLYERALIDKNTYESVNIKLLKKIEKYKGLDNEL